VAEAVGVCVCAGPIHDEGTDAGVGGATDVEAACAGAGTGAVVAAGVKPVSAKRICFGLIAVLGGVMVAFRASDVAMVS